MLLAGAIPTLSRDNLPESSSERSNQIVNVSSVLFPLNLLLTLHGLTSCAENLLINQLPRCLAARVPTSPFVVPLQPILQIIGVTDIVTIIFLTLEDIYVVYHRLIQESLPSQAGFSIFGGSDPDLKSGQPSRVYFWRERRGLNPQPPT